VTAQAKYMRHFLPDQIVDDDLSPIELVGRHSLTPLMNKTATAAQRRRTLFLIMPQVN
jgi:hypothetical protein